tara:strand:+ start:3644 stop:4699 length:1056 start_codon:yes stop_codon:yes gene_type:complete
MNKFIAIVGMCGSGKSVVSDEFVKRGYHFFRFGQITLDYIKQKGLEPNESTQKQVRESFREKHGMGAYAILNLPHIEELLKRGNVIGDGLYSWSEYKILKEKFSDKLIIVAVYTPPNLRYERISKRKPNINDIQLRNHSFSIEEAKSRDFSEIENIEKGGPIAMADYLIINDATIDILKLNTKKIINQIEGKKYTRPSWEEYFMELTRTVGKRGTCDRGRSGCIIIKNKKILATGYVGSPRGLEHCDEIGHQFKSVTHEDGTTTNHCVRTTHAEQNAICQAAENGISIKGATIYCKMEPCSVCAKMIINSGITKVVCEKRYHSAQDSRDMFKKADIDLEVLNDEIESYEKQ